MTNKITVKDYFMELRALAERADRADLVAFVDSRIKQVEAKNSKRSNKPSKSASMTADLAEKVLALMEQDVRYTATDLMKMVGNPDISNQRMTAALNVLVNTDFVKNEKVKGKSLFYKV